MNLLRPIDDFLNNLTMYRLLSYGLSLLAVISVVLSLFGVVTFSAWGMVIALGLTLSACYLTNVIFARIWQIAANRESWFISALILFFILPQATTLTRGIFIFLAGVIAMVSKYIIAWHGKHLFNPAAFGAAVLGTAGLLGVTWWVGNSTLWPFVLIFGLLVVRKIRRFALLVSFALVSIATAVTGAMLRDIPVGTVLETTLTASPLIFLGTIMATEPSTMPPRRRLQIIFGGLVGLLYAAQISIGGLFVSPELALLAGNAFAFAVSPKYRVRLQLKEVQKISQRLYNFVFTPDRALDFLPGQYLEWTLDHGTPDSRGNRRTFTIASSPTEKTVQLGVTFYEPSSSFKQRLKNLKPGESLLAGQVAGNFILPADTKKKLVFVAGGIGITPFRSMLRYLVDRQEKRDITLLYMVSSPEEVAYKDVLKQAANVGVRVVPVVSGKTVPQSWKGQTGLFTQALVTQEIPDYADRTFYISGPQAMINHAKGELAKLHIPRSHIETDFFSGY